MQVLSIAERLQHVTRYFLGDETENTPETQNPSDMLMQIEAARQEWLGTRAYFDNVTEKALIDHAILSMQASERKYMYLLDVAKKNGIRVKEEYCLNPPRRME